MSKVSGGNLEYTPSLIPGYGPGLRGLLFKRGDTTGQWNSRYFVLEQNRLLHFNDPSSDRPTRILKLNECSIGPLVSSGAKLSFQIDVPFLARKYVLGLEDHQRISQWHEAILKAQNPDRTKLEQKCEEDSDSFSTEFGDEDLMEKRRDLSRDVDLAQVEHQFGFTDGWALEDVGRLGVSSFSPANGSRPSFPLASLALSVLRFLALSGGIYFGLQLLKTKYLLKYSSYEVQNALMCVSLVHGLILATKPAFPINTFVTMGISLCSHGVTLVLSPFLRELVLCFILGLTLELIFNCLVLNELVSATKVSRATVVVSCGNLIATNLIWDVEHRNKWDPFFKLSELKNSGENQKTIKSSLKRSNPILKPVFQLMRMEKSVLKDGRITAVSCKESNNSFLFLLSSSRPKSVQITLDMKCLAVGPEAQDLLRALVVFIESLSDSALESLTQRFTPKLASAPVSSSSMKPQIRVSEEQEHRRMLHEVKNIALREINGGEEIGYKLVVDNSVGKVWKKESKFRTGTCLKMTGKVMREMKYVLKFVSDITKKPLYDPLCAKGEDIKSYSDITKLIRQETMSMWPVSSKEFLSVAGLFDLNDGSLVLVTRSIDHNLCPDNPKYVRAFIDYGALLFQPCDDGKNTMFTLALDADMKQALPSFIMDIVIKSHVQQLENINKHTKTMSDSDCWDIEHLKKCIFEADSSDPRASDSTIPSSTESVDQKSNPFAQTCEEALRDIQEFANESRLDEWECFDEQKDVKLYRKKCSDAVPPTKGVGIIDASPLHVLLCLTDLSNKNGWDEMFEKGHIVQELDDVSQVTYQLFYGIWPVAQRDFISANTFRILDDGTVIAAARSIDFPGGPSQKGAVRGKIRLGGMVAKPLPDGKSLVSYIASVDLGGSIPSSMIKMLSTKQPLVVHGLRTAINKMGLKSQDTSQFIERNSKFLKSRSILESLAPFSPSRVIASAPSPPPSASLAAVSPPTSCAAPVSVEMKPVNLTSRDSSRGSEDSFAAVAAEASRSMKAALDPSLSWSPFFGRDGIKVFQTVLSSSDIPVTKSIAIVQAASEDVLGILGTLSRRKWIDDLVSDSLLVQTLTGNSAIYRLLYQPREACRAPAREFIILAKQEKLANGSFLISMTSVTHPDVIPLRGLVVGRLVLGGFLIEDGGKAPNGQQLSKVTCISQVDLGGQVPTWVKNLPLKQQPLVLTQLIQLFST